MENQDKEHIGRYMYRQITNIIGRLLIAERESLGLTTREVALQNGMKEQYVKNTERGANKMNWRNAGKLLMFYKKRVVISFEDDDGTISKVLTREEWQRRFVGDGRS
ncbi:MAG: hypothetical protein NC218_07935 [Acetobacter sp.]|nr:hypothetical protein [Acetobacter sp.]